MVWDILIVNMLLMSSFLVGYATPTTLICTAMSGFFYLYQELVIPFPFWLLVSFFVVEILNYECGPKIAKKKQTTKDKEVKKVLD